MDALKNPTIYLGSLRIDEPVTTLTDLVVAFVGIGAFLRTRSSGYTGGMNLYRWFLLVTGISTGVSALLGHAFSYAVGPGFKLAGWILGMASVILAQFAALVHTRPVLKETTYKTLVAINLLEMVLALVVLLIMRTFLAVEIHSAFGLLIVATSLEAFYFSKIRSAFSRYFITGVGLSIVAVSCHLLKLAISPWFNHLDLSHVFMALALLTMYSGLKKEQQIQIPSLS